MKIGILTYHCVPNFGAQLQTLSTVCYLRNHGHEPIVLHWYPTDLEDIYRWLPSDQLEEHNIFTKSNFPLSELCRKESELIQEIEKLGIEAILLGSDALFKYIPIKCRWYLKLGKYRPSIVIDKVPCVEKLHNNPFFGDFLYKMKKHLPSAVYAVSAQNTAYERMLPVERRLMKSYMNNFDIISVRDIRTQSMVKKVAGLTSVNIYPDPVFAFNKNVGELIPTRDEILRKFGIEKDYVLLSFRTDACSDEYIDSLATCIRRKGLLPIAFTMPEGVRSAGIEKVIAPPLSPIDWYALIKYASGYIGERMHPLIVALHNSTPCFSFDEYGCVGRKARVLYPRPIEFKKEQSKIYHIMQEAGFAENWHSLISKDNLPFPEYVVEKVLSFDREKCASFSNIQYGKYSDGMSQMMDVLTRKS